MNDFTQFLEQPFVAPALTMLCVMSILLIVVVGALIYVRRRKAQRRDRPASGFASTAAASDMPDLYELMSDLPSAPAAPAAPARSGRKGTFTVRVQDAGSAEVVEVMAVLRDVTAGTLVVQMGDKIYQNVNADSDFRDRFTRLVRELTQVSQADTPPAVARAAPEPTIQPPRPAAPPASSADELPGALPRFSLDDQGPIKPARGQKREVKPVPEINIAGAIEAFVQHKLRAIPAYGSRSIHIYPAPDGGVSIEVDGHYYDSVADVDDAGVREFLQTAIQEWQERR